MRNGGGDSTPLPFLPFWPALLANPTLLEEAMTHVRNLQKLLLSQFLSMTAVHRDRGASMVEYALLLVLMALIVIAALRLLGTTVSDTIQDPELIDGLSDN